MYGSEKFYFLLSFPPSVVKIFLRKSPLIVSNERLFHGRGPNREQRHWYVPPQTQF
jgi:hypothetical protein